MLGAVTSFSCQTVVKARSSCRTEEEKEREREREGEPALALSRGEDKCVLSPSFSSLNAGFVYAAPFSYFFSPW